LLKVDKVDRVGDSIDRDRLSNSSCCRFVAKTDNKVDRIGNKVDRIGNSRLCRQCVPGLKGTGFSDTPDISKLLFEGQFSIVILPKIPLM